MFNNAITYQIDPSFRVDPEVLGRRPAKPCGVFDTKTDGFIEPRKGSGLVHTVTGNQLICWETETKLLPGSVISDAVAERAEKIEEEQGRKVGRKEMRDLKDQVTTELLPKAFVQHRRTFAVLVGPYLIIDTSSQARADAFMEAFIRTLEVMPRRPLTTVSPVFGMTEWLASGDAPAGFTIDSTLDLCSVAEKSSSIQYKHHDISGPEVVAHIAAGKVATKLGITYNDRVSFVLTEQLHIKRIQLLDIIREEAERQAENTDELFDINVTLYAGEVVKILDAIGIALGGYTKPDDLLPAS